MGENKWQLGEKEMGTGKEVCDLGEKRWELEEKRVKVGENEWELRRKRMESGRKRGESWKKMGRELLGKMFEKMGREKCELEEKGVKNWDLKGLEQERKLLGDERLHDTFFIIKLLKPKYIFFN